MLATIEGRPLPTVPCSTRKAPLGPHGWDSATTEPAQFEALRARYPGAPYIGVPTGPRSGLVAIDIDPRNGGDRWLAEVRDRLPRTRVHRTGGGGWHFIYLDAPGLHCRQAIVPGVDFRAAGGGVVWWAAAGLDWCDEPVAALGWLREFVTERIVKPGRNQQNEGWSPPIASDAADLPPASTLDREVTILLTFKKTARRWSREETFGLYSANRAQDRLGKAPVGQRNHALNGEAYALGRQVARGWLSGDHALLSLWLGAKACGYVRDHGETLTIAAIRHGLLDGMRVPYPDLGEARTAGTFGTPLAL